MLCRPVRPGRHFCLTTRCDKVCCSLTFVIFISLITQPQSSLSSGFFWSFICVQVNKQGQRRSVVQLKSIMFNNLKMNKTYNRQVWATVLLVFWEYSTNSVYGYIYHFGFVQCFRSMRLLSAVTKHFMLHSGWPETNDWAHKLIRKVFSEVTEKGHAVGHFSVALYSTWSFDTIRGGTTCWLLERMQT